jgi:signal transduction histidine kinase
MQGLYNNGVFHILEDARGNFWISCNRGIYRVNKQELNDYADGRVSAITSVAYGKQDGMINIECNGGRQPAGIKTHDGRLWFPTQQGVAIIDPETVPVNSNPPIVVIEACFLDRASVDFSSALEIAPGLQDLEINYTGLSFLKSELIRFKYKLEGLDSEWIDAGTRRTAYYSRIPPGAYTFLVTAANSDGIWNTEGASIQVIVHPPFWKNWWFIALAAISIVGLTLLIYERRVSRLETARAAQEAFSRQLISSQEHERKRIAADLHDSLGQNLLVIKNRAIFGGSLCDSDAAREQFEEITESVSSSLEEVRQIAYNLRPYHLDRLGLTSTLEAMIEKMEETSAIEFLCEIEPIDALFSKEEEINLYRIVQESINNVVKHSDATAARVSIKRDADNLHLKIEDNGKGFEVGPSAASESHRLGFGLTGLSERVRMLKGTLALDSALGRGSKTTIKLPLPRARKEQRDE